MVGQCPPDLADSLPQRQMYRRSAVEPGDALVRGQRRDQCRADHQRAAGPTIRAIAIEIELPDRIALRWDQEHPERQHQHRQAASPGKDEPPAGYRRALVIVAGQAGHHGKRRDFIARYRRAHQEGKQQQIAIEPAIAHRRRVPQHHPSGGHRQDRGIHPRMALAPFAVGLVAPIADQRVDQGIEQQRDQQHQPDQPRLQSEHLTVEQQQQHRKTVVFDAVSNRSSAIAQLDA